MDDGLKLEKSTGFTPSIKTAKGTGSVRRKSTGKKKVSPVLITVPTRDASLISTVGASHILAVQVMMGDYRELKNRIPASWQASSNGKIYWCAEMPGHKLAVVDGSLMIDGVPASMLLKNLLAEPAQEPRQSAESRMK